jgi:hypothetical protein
MQRAAVGELSPRPAVAWLLIVDTKTNQITSETAAPRQHTNKTARGSRLFASRSDE